MCEMRYLFAHCRKGNLERLPKECPISDNTDIYDKALARYRDDPKQLACQSVQKEMVEKTREIIEFTKLSGFSELHLWLFALDYVKRDGSQ